MVLTQVMLLDHLDLGVLLGALPLSRRQLLRRRRMTRLPVSGVRLRRRQRRPRLPRAVLSLGRRQLRAGSSAPRHRLAGPSYSRRSDTHAMLLRCNRATSSEQVVMRMKGGSEAPGCDEMASTRVSNAHCDRPRNPRPGPMSGLGQNKRQI